VDKSPAHTTTSDRRAPEPVIHSGYKTVKRVIHTSLMVAAIFLSVAIILRYQYYQEAWLSHEASQPGELLSRQYSKAIAPLIEEENNDAVNRMLTLLKSEPMIIDAALFHADGRPRGEHATSLSLTALYKDGPSRSPITHLATIESSDGIQLGYLRLLIDQKALLAQPLSLNRQREEMFLEVAGLALLIGIYLCRTFYKLRPTFRLWFYAKNKPKRYYGNANRRQ